MEERELRASIEQVRVGTLSRRRFVQAMVGLGLTAPMAAQMLASAGVAQAQTKTTYKPTKRGGGGALRVLWSQRATLLHPHVAVGACTTSGTYEKIKVDNVDGHTVKITFPKPTPFWADPFVGVRGMIIPKHLFEGFKGAKSREAPANLKPVGTGPYRFADFKPGDLVKGELNPTYHMPNRPHFDTIEMKGG